MSQHSDQRRGRLDRSWRNVLAWHFGWTMSDDCMCLAHIWKVLKMTLSVIVVKNVQNRKSADIGNPKVFAWRRRMAWNSREKKKIKYFNIFTRIFCLYHGQRQIFQEFLWMLLILYVPHLTLSGRLAHYCYVALLKKKKKKSKCLSGAQQNTYAMRRISHIPSTLKQMLPVHCLHYH